VRSLLKALGLTIWGLIAFGLIAVFIIVGYQAALRLRSVNAPSAETPSTKAQSGGIPAVTHAGTDTAEKVKSSSQSVRVNSDAIRTMFRAAAEQHHNVATVESGKQLFDSGSATPNDLVIIAHAFSSMDDCPNALVWVARANQAFQAAGSNPGESIDWIMLRCGSGNQRSIPPQLDANTATQLGLAKGGVTHPENAYVYLGLSELALKNNVEACNAFAKLKDVPNISPRMLRLWELFADTHC
jgi:hypothetical protein